MTALAKWLAANPPFNRRGFPIFIAILAATYGAAYAIANLLA